jgi:hypothetical protein
MAVERLDPDSAEYAWASSVVQAVGRATGRPVRWDQTVLVADDPATLNSRLVGSRAFHSSADGVVLSRAQLDAVSLAIEHSDRTGRVGATAPTPVESQSRWMGLADATGAVGAQAARLTGPQAERTGMVAGAEGDLDRGLGDVWVQENLSGVWNDSESSRILTADAVPNPMLAYGGGSEMTATRDAITELVGQRDNGRLADPADYSAVADQLIQTPPDQRWQAMTEMVPGVDRLDADQRNDLANHSFRQDFQNAVRIGNPGAGTPRSSASTAVREIQHQLDDLSKTTGGVPLDSRTRSFANDPSQPSARLAAAGTTERPTETGPTAGGVPTGRKVQPPARGD